MGGRYKHVTRFPILCRKCEQLPRPQVHADLCWGCFDFYNDLLPGRPPTRVEPDPVVIERIIREGPQPRAHHCEKKLAAMTMLGLGVSHRKIAARVGATDRSVTRWAAERRQSVA